MANPVAGYLFFVLMAGLIFGVAYWGYRRHAVTTVDDFVAGGRHMGFGIIAASIMASWIWTTTLIGASEAGMWFGASGGFHYAWGAVVPFIVFIPVALRLRRIMPRVSTFAEFVRERYGVGVHALFLLFGIGVGFYVYTEQLVGAGILFKTTFGVPYKVAVVLTAALVISYIALGGLRGSIVTDVFQFFVVAIACFVLIPWLLVKIGGPDFLFEGLQRVAADAEDPNYNPDADNWLTGAGFRYGMAAVVIAMGQVLLEQGYYQRAVAAMDQKNLRWAYILGGIVAWFPIPLMFGLVVGGTGLAMGARCRPGAGLDQRCGTLRHEQRDWPGRRHPVRHNGLHGGNLDGGHLAGRRAVALHRRYLRALLAQGAGRRAAAAQVRPYRLGALRLGGMAVALGLEGQSLLLIDIFSGILFASPVAALVLGLFWRRASASAAVISIVVGLGGGLSAWFAIPDEDINWFVGNAISLGAPIILMVLLPLLRKEDFQFGRLLDWRPTHRVVGGERPATIGGAAQ